MALRRVRRAVRETTQNPGKSSTVAIMQHPLHPMVVVFPIAFLIGMLPTDLVWLWTGDALWANFSFWLGVAGLGIALLAAVLGMADLFTMREARKHVSAWSHFISGVMVLALASGNVYLRVSEGVEAVWPWGLAMSGVCALVVMVTGWLGGTLTFRHDIGTYGDEFRGQDHVGEDDDPDEPAKD